ncbi:BRCT domain-containing protein [Actinomadura fulvescens]
MTNAPGLTEIDDQAAYAAAVQTAVSAAAAYYGEGDSPLDDDAFDRLVRGIAAYEQAHPEHVLPDSPTGKVAGGAVIGAPLIDKLVAAGLTMTEPGATAPGPATSAEEPSADLPLAGLSVVVTGAMSGPLADLSRNEMNELVERAGGKASSSVSARTSFLVAGDKAGSKRAKAEKLGVEIKTPEEFAALVADHLL